ncbi:MAG: NERD domain-containing protein [Actinobacteria bacterium]|nr:NERD domain-containing protein [Actinomycetota bacterium]
MLEQIVDDYLQLQGYFTIHNVRFKPSADHAEYVSSKDSVPSDVDVVGFNPALPPPRRRVMVASCKSWQGGVDRPRILAQLRDEAPNPVRPQWLRFRELWSPKWAEAFRARIAELTGEEAFTHAIAVTHLRGDRRLGRRSDRRALPERQPL